VERSIRGTNAPLYQTTSMVPSLAFAVLGSTCASAAKTSDVRTAAGGGRRGRVPPVLQVFGLPAHEKRHRLPPIPSPR
jgi:hypothetical protein